MLASALLCFLFARGGAAWMLGFVALAPWLRALDKEPTLGGALRGAWAMSVAFTAAAFGWFGSAIGSYTQLGTGIGITVLLLAAPLFQPQFLAFALVRHVTGRRHGAVLRAFTATAAWVATESLVPRLLGDTLGYGLYPSRVLRQAADVGGTAGLTVMLLLANEAVAAAIARRSDGGRAVARPLACALLVPLLLAGYGLVALSSEPAGGQPLRVGMVQSNITDYERLRREKGPAAVVREVLDTHYAMSYDAVERQHADAVLWSETVYPTTFGHPKSEAGAELDSEILGIVDAARVPFVFGTYDRDASGEYNAAAFVAPGNGVLGMYRKTRLFALTEYVPPWLDGSLLRRWLPWTGSWQPGTGARVFPLRLADGREVPVLPLVCLDDVDTGLAVDGARLGAQAILTLSNDAWFPAHGAQLHQAAAAFRSIETQLPQFRVTTNGYSAVIDPTGNVIAGTRRGERTLVVGDVAVREAPRTLMVAWGDWVGRAAVAFLVLLALVAAARRWAAYNDAHSSADEAAPAVPVHIAVLPPIARIAAGLLRVLARGSLLWLAAVLVSGSGPLQGNTFAQLRAFTTFFLVPEVAAWCVLRAFMARAAIEQGVLVLQRGQQRLRLALGEIVAVDAWRLPVPMPGVSLRLASGRHWRYGLAMGDPWSFSRAVLGSRAASTSVAPSRATAYAHARSAVRPGRWQHPLARFVLLPLLLAIPAFRLHQHIAFGSAFGEYYTFGLVAYLRAFALWWASWAIGTVLCAAVLRAVIEAGTLAAVLLRPRSATDVRRWLERFGVVALYAGLPSWLLLRLLAA
ncbi:apolipoprotein N-acyltransferase [Ramlibacter sp. MMS24-I3-19]|uniref:apolipoprotein N-acyltransferase n=1 Tax=Ramlibacter sp. MMS24-I3-19 TaxID=3416606 RepID=UPI003D01D106